MTITTNRKSRLASILVKPFVLWGLAAQATALAVQWILKHEELSSSARLMLGFLPTLMAILFVVAFVKGIRKSDEMLRRIHQQAAATAFLLIVILTFACDGLKSTGVYTATLSDLDSATVFIWAAALIFFSVRYR